MFYVDWELGGQKNSRVGILLSKNLGYRKQTFNPLLVYFTVLLYIVDLAVSTLGKAHFDASFSKGLHSSHTHLGILTDH